MAVYCGPVTTGDVGLMAVYCGSVSTGDLWPYIVVL